MYMYFFSSSPVAVLVSPAAEAEFEENGSDLNMSSPLVIPPPPSPPPPPPPTDCEINTHKRTESPYNSPMYLPWYHAKEPVLQQVFVFISQRMEHVLLDVL